MADAEGEQMATEKDPAEIVATLRRSIQASQRGSRRVRAHRFKDLFGFQAWSLRGGRWWPGSCRMKGS
jgi:hypothetical protein